jgi:hypothetical protein
VKAVPVGLLITKIIVEPTRVGVTVIGESHQRVVERVKVDEPSIWTSMLTIVGTCVSTKKKGN